MSHCTYLGDYESDRDVYLLHCEPAGYYNSTKKDFFHGCNQKCKNQKCNFFFLVELGNLKQKDF